MQWLTTITPRTNAARKISLIYVGQKTVLGRINRGFSCNNEVLSLRYKCGKKNRKGLRRASELEALEESGRNQEEKDQSGCDPVNSENEL